MDEVIRQLLFFVASYGGLILVIFFAINWISKGWLTIFLKVKASRGKKLLVIAHGVANTYFRTGEFVDSVRFRFKDRTGKWLTFNTVKSEDIRQIMGCSALEVDVPTSCIISKGNPKAGVSGEEIDDLMTRIIQAPKVGDNFLLAILIISILTLILVIVAVGFGVSNNQAIEGLKLAGMIV